MEVALVHMAEQVCGVWPELPIVDEVPFDTDRKRLSTLHLTLGSQVLYTKGALETVLPLCTHIASGNGVVPISTESREAMLCAEQELAAQGLRVLAFASREVAEEEPREQ